MKPGIELDILIAEKIMGLKVIKNKSGSKRGGYYYSIDNPVWYDLSGDMQLQNSIPRYSIKISKAWQVWRHLRKTGKWCCLTLTINSFDDCYSVALTPNIVSSSDSEHKPTITVNAKSAAHAICLAALETLK